MLFYYFICPWYLLEFTERRVQPQDVATILGELNFCKQLQLFIRDQTQDIDPESDMSSSSLDLPSTQKNTHLLLCRSYILLAEQHFWC